MRTLLLVIVSISIGLSVFAQEPVSNEVRNEKSPSSLPSSEGPVSTTQEVKKNASVTISKRPGEEQKIHDAAYFDAEIAKIDAQIVAMNSKIATVNADPNEKALAENSGWFEDMERIKERLNIKRSDLLEQRSKL